MNQEMQQVREHMRALAKGVDPFTMEPLGADTMLNDVTLARSFYYVAEVLDSLIRNGGTLEDRRGSLDPFVWNDQMRERMPFKDSPTITELVRRINRWAAEFNMKKLAYQRITTWLLDAGYLKEVLDENQKKRRMPTKEGESIGLQIEARFGMYSNYEVILYTKKAQKFLSEHMEEILAHQGKEKVKTEESFEDMMDSEMEELFQEVI